MSTESDDRIAGLRAALLRSERALPTSGLSRLLRTGRSAAGLASSVLGGRLRGRGDGLAAADLEAVAKLVSQLGELKGVAMKAGQILGYIDPTLPEELRGLLSLLQTASAASPFPTVQATIREALPDRGDGLCAGLEPAPLAVASIGQVHRGKLTDGTEVAVKVRHPGIEAALRSDFRTAAVGPAMAMLFGVRAGDSVRGLITEAREAMLEECDFGLEAERQATFAGLFASHDSILVPALLPELCARSILTARYEPGSSLDTLLAGDPPQAVRDRLGVTLFSFYIGTLYRHGLFHADPHPGNFAFRTSQSARPEERVVIYDFGCVRRFDRATVRSFARLLAAVRADEDEAIGAALGALGARPPTEEKARVHLRTLLRGFFAPMLRAGARPIDPGAAFEARQAMRDKRAAMQLSLPGKLLFLMRLRFGLYAVLARLGAVADWAELESGWAHDCLAVDEA